MPSAKWEEAYRAGVTYAYLNLKPGQVDTGDFAVAYANYAESVEVGSITAARFYREVWAAA